tara:strand:+ start:1299 stop:1940 length:642 start_codon:yes stop_codon:yes gene_type:complete
MVKLKKVLEMTIEKGKEWGQEFECLRPDLLAKSDRDVREVVEEAWRQRLPIPTVGLLGGDIWKTLGSPPGGTERLKNGPVRRVNMDLIDLRLPGARCAAFAHAVFLEGWWFGNIAAVMNAEWRKAWRVAPRAHPNDGWLDLIAGNLRLRQRILARRRLPMGNHLPNSNLDTRRIQQLELEFDRPRRVLLDGVDEGKHLSVSLSVVPDALSIIY